MNNTIFERIVDDLYSQGYSIQRDALPREISDALLEHLHTVDKPRFKPAGIGRGTDYTKSKAVRSNKILWITGNTPAGQQWLAWANTLKQQINQQLFLGLFSFESHFAYYGVGDFYKRHLDAFKGESNRRLSLVTYLNQNWSEQDGGELVLYKNDEDETGIRIKPEFGTVVIFLSEDFPHEVLPAQRDRYSIAGWFRINASHTNKVDPPN